MQRIIPNFLVGGPAKMRFHLPQLLPETTSGDLYVAGKANKIFSPWLWPGYRLLPAAVFCQCCCWKDGRRSNLTYFLLPLWLKESKSSTRIWNWFLPAQTRLSALIQAGACVSTTERKTCHFKEALEANARQRADHPLRVSKERRNGLQIRKEMTGKTMPVSALYRGQYVRL